MNYSRFANPTAVIGTIVSAASCPACFPALAALGPTVFSEYEGLIISKVLPLMAGIALLSHVAGWRVHRQWQRTLPGVLGPALVLLATLMYLGTSLGNWMFDVGVVAMVAASAWDLL